MSLRFGDEKLAAAAAAAAAVNGKLIGIFVSPLGCFWPMCVTR